MGYNAPALLSAFALIVVVFHARGNEQKRPITVEDCVKTRRIVEQEVQISPDGAQVAYIVKAPNLATNRNDYQLYIRDLRQTGRRENGRLLLQADQVSGIRWLRSGRIAARVQRKSEKRDAGNEVDIVDTRTGSVERLEFPNPMEDYSISADGEVVVFSSSAKAEASSSATQSEEQKLREARGYRILYGESNRGGLDHPPEYEIYLGKRTGAGKLETTKLSFVGPGDVSRRSSLPWAELLNLSPDGRYLLLTYVTDSLPPEWEEHSLIKHLRALGTRAETHVLGLYDIATGKLRLAFNFPGVFIARTRWSDDSHAYSVVSPSPFGTSEGTREEKAAEAFGTMYFFLDRFYHVFTVDVETGMVAKALQRDSGTPGDSKFLYDGPDRSFVRMAIRDRKWEQTGRFELPEDARFQTSFASDGHVLVAISQAPMIPPDLTLLDLRTKETTLLTDLNPEYRSIALGETEKLEWTTRYGSKCAGLMIKPIGYETGKRYPMVFLAAPVRKDFISDAGYTTAYAPQSLANSGFLVVVAQYPIDNKVSKGEFPGEMSVAYNWMAMVESAVDLLSDRGIVNKNNVGIGGFSRTSWLARFTITHSTYSFVAASLADSSLYSYGQYYRYNSLRAIEGAENQIGGPPYGQTFEYWLKYSDPFNADRVRAAVLMEFTPPIENAYEFFVALARQGKPVELYHYPKGAHPLDTPFERVASLQRNVDWFRFWMQGYEGKAPDYDPGQYVRWRELRKLQKKNEATRTPKQ